MSDDRLRRLDEQLRQSPRWWDRPGIVIPVIAAVVGGLGVYLGYLSQSIPPRPIIVHVDLPQPLIIKVVP